MNDSVPFISTVTEAGKDRARMPNLKTSSVTYFLLIMSHDSIHRNSVEGMNIPFRKL